MSAISQAVELAIKRGLLTTELGSREAAELVQSLEERAFWSARTTHAWYLRELKKLVERYVRGEGRDNDLGQLRMEARELLARAGYTPEKGFPGDEALGIPPAEPGSLRDLRSEPRLNLIFETQASLMRGLGQKVRGLDRIEQFPAWELVRFHQVRAPRDWYERWQQAGASFAVINGEPRLIAPKDAEVWSVLGDRAVFEDALGVDHPPFAWNSGMGWLEVDWETWEQVEWNGARRADMERIPEAVEPVEEVFIGGQATLDRLLANLRERHGRAR
jgi:hypothetical protein